MNDHALSALERKCLTDVDGARINALEAQRRLNKSPRADELEFFRGLLETFSYLAMLRQVHGIEEDLRPLAERIRAKRYRLRFWSPL